MGFKDYNETSLGGPLSAHHTYQWCSANVRHSANHFTFTESVNYHNSMRQGLLAHLTDEETDTEVKQLVQDHTINE
jgi:hypothetical protein